MVPARVARRQAARRPARVARGAAAPVADSLRPVDTLPLIALPTLELSSIDIPRADLDLELNGMWRTLSWD